MDAPDWYEAWCEEAFDAFTAKQKQLTETYRLDAWDRYDYDANAGLLTFSDERGPRVVAEMQVLGSTESEWLWGWANTDWPAKSVEALKAVQEFGAANGIEELTTEVLRSDDLVGMGWMLAAIAVRILDAEGAYRVPTAEGGLYLILRSIKSVS